MAEGRDLVKEALQDAKQLREAALETAKNELIEQMAPAVRNLLSKSIMGLNEQSRAPEFKGAEGGTQQQKKDYDPDGSITPELHEAPQETETMAEEKEGCEEKKVEEGAETVAEEIEISEAELRKVYEAALQTEVQIKKGFTAIKPPAELDDAHKDQGLLPNQGEKHFDQGEAKYKKDWTVKEMLEKGLAENKQLRENLRKAVAMIETLGKKLHEVNLFNSKVLHVNKILNSGQKLTKEQKTFVMESIDKAGSIKEVKMIYETIVGSMKNVALVTESKNTRPPKADAQKARGTGTPKQEVLSESVDRANDDARFSRIRELAGLVNGRK